MLKAVGRGCGDGRPAEFGEGFTTLIPKTKVTMIGDQLYGQVDQTRTQTIYNTDAQVYVLSLNDVLALAFAAVISDDQCRFITGRTKVASVMLCESVFWRGCCCVPMRGEARLPLELLVVRSVRR